MRQMHLSARAYHRTQSVKLARTIADLTGETNIQTPHIAEAIQSHREASALPAPADGVKVKVLR